MADVPVSPLTAREDSLSSEPRDRLLWAPVVAYMAFIFALSSIPFTPSAVQSLDKSLHGLLYGGFGLLVARALNRGLRRCVTFGVVLGTVLIAVAYGVSDEFHQSFVPPRTPSALDVVADGAGAAIAALSLYAWGIIRGRHDL